MPARGLGRQELDGVLLEDAEGALWTLGMLDGRASRRRPSFDRIVVAVDPPVTGHGRRTPAGSSWPVSAWAEPQRLAGLCA